MVRFWPLTKKDSGFWSEQKSNFQLLSVFADTCIKPSTSSNQTRRDSWTTVDGENGGRFNRKKSFFTPEGPKIVLKWQMKTCMDWQTSRNATLD